MNWGTDTKIQQTPQTEDVKHAINRGVRTRLTNPKWIEGLLEHPYHGVQRMAKNTENTENTENLLGILVEFKRCISGSGSLDGVNEEIARIKEEEDTDTAG